MNIANLPVASPFHPTPPEPRQRVTEFRQLGLALMAGNITEALKLVGILQLNAPNAALAAQKQRTFGHDNFEGQDLDILENALKGGDIKLAQTAYTAIKAHSEGIRKVHRRTDDDSAENPDQETGADSEPPRNSDDQPDSGNSPLDILA
jgi:hypothetical protein